MQFIILVKGYGPTETAAKAMSAAETDKLLAFAFNDHHTIQNEDEARDILRRLYGDQG